MATIRLANPSDALACAEMYAPAVRDSATSFELDPPDADAMGERIRTTLPTHPWLVCEHDGRAIGYAYAGPHRHRAAYQWSVDASVYVDDRFHRHGIARGLYTSLFAVLQLQGYYNVYAGTALPNPATVAFHRAMGFESVGIYRDVGYKAGEWRDVQWWYRSLGPHPDDPDPPTPLRDVRETAEGAAAVRSGQDRIDL